MSDFAELAKQQIAWSRKLRELLDSGTQEDVHRMMAAWALQKDEADVTAEERSWAKMMSFPYMYGGIHG